MLIILAASHDSTARELAIRWPNAALLTSCDLSRRGWRHENTARANRARSMAVECAVVNGEIVQAEMISAVYNRLPWVFTHELSEIRKEDRQYVAAEMNAFLLSWLSSLRCPIVNKPSPLGLAGPNLRPEAWTFLAARENIPVRPVLRSSINHQADEMLKHDVVTVVGEQCFGHADIVIQRRAQSLAKAAGVELLTLAFDCGTSDAPFIWAEPWADVSIPGVENAILDLLCKSEAMKRNATL